MARPRSYPYGADIRSSHLSFSAGNAGLDFANTRELRRGEAPQEYLHDYGDLLLFAERIGLLDDDELECLTETAASEPAAASASFRRAVRLREAIYGAISRIAGGERASTRDIGRIDQTWRKAAASSDLMWLGGYYGRVWTADDGRLDLPHWRIADAAVSLLTSTNLVRARECAARDCGWVFLDSSPAARRRWCDMRTCGNRAKASRHYSLRKSSAALG